jgi:hypothetical protein
MSLMRRTNWKTVSTLVTAVVIMGCQDRAVTAPSGAASGVVSAQLAPPDRPQLSSGDIGNTANGSGDFTISPNGGMIFVGGTAVIFPAGSICDPATSSYGQGTWDQPCTPVSGPVTIHAVVRTTKAGTWVDFSPALRFVPSNNPLRWVWLFMQNPSKAGASAINYASSIGDTGIDESISDSSLRTYNDGSILFRRIKHFSGYTSSSGRSCDPQTDSDCSPDNGGTGVTGGP